MGCWGPPEEAADSRCLSPLFSEHAPSIEEWVESPAPKMIMIIIPLVLKRLMLCIQHSECFIYILTYLTVYV